MDAEQLFNDHYHIAEATVNRMYIDKKYIAKINGIEVEDLYQYAREALWEAALQFDNTKGNRTFRTFAITNIRWSLIERVRRDCKKFSLRGTGLGTKEISQKIKIVSLDDTPRNDDEESKTYHDLIASNIDTFEETMGKLLNKKVKEIFPSRTQEFIKLKLSGMKIREIGKMYGISHQAVDQNIRQHAKKLKGVI